MHQFTFPPTMHKDSFFTSSTLTSCCFDDSHSSMCEVVSYSGLGLHFSDDYWCWTPFHVVQLLSHVWVFETPRTAALGFPILHYLPEFAQTHVHWVSDAIQSLHPLFPPSPLALSLSQHQGLFQWLTASGGQSIGVSHSASVLPINIQVWFPLGLSDFISLLSKGLSKVFSSTTVQKHQFFGAQLSSQSNSHIHTLLEKL